MGRGDLLDAEWDLIGPLLPPERGRWARPAGDNRRILNGMLHVLRVGCPRLVDEDQALGIEIELTIEPALALSQNVGTVLLDSMASFLRVMPRRAKK